MAVRRTVAASASSIQNRLSRSFSRIPAEDTPRLFRLPLAEIEPNPEQPRRYIDEEGLRELAKSIERHGLIQPITVQRLLGTGRYLLVAGERRFRAHQLLGRAEILAIVTTGEADEISLIENIQREDLHPLEEAAAYARMMERHGWTQEQLAQVVGKARTTITNTLKLNRLSEAIRAASLGQRGNGPSKSLLFEIARLEGEAAQTALWEQVREGSTVRAARSRNRPGPDQPLAQPTGEVRNSTAGALLAGRRLLNALRALAVEQLGEQQRRELLELGREVTAILEALTRPATTEGPRRR